MDVPITSPIFVENSNIPKALDDISPAIDSTDGLLYGQMTMPKSELPIGRVAQAIQDVACSTRRVSASLADAIRRDPFSAALFGVGVAYLVVQWQARKRDDNTPVIRVTNGAKVLGRVVSDGMTTSLRLADATVGNQINEIKESVRVLANDTLNHVNGAHRDAADHVTHVTHFLSAKPPAIVE